MKVISDVTSIVFAITAAVYWIKSAYVSAPKDSGVMTFAKGLTSRMATIPGQTLYDAKEGDSLINKERFFQSMAALMDSYTRQSKLSATAAICAALSASLQALSYLISLLHTTQAGM